MEGKRNREEVQEDEKNMEKTHCQWRPFEECSERNDKRNILIYNPIHGRTDDCEFFHGKSRILKTTLRIYFLLIVKHEIHQIVKCTLHSPLYNWSFFASWKTGTEETNYRLQDTQLEMKTHLFMMNRWNETDLIIPCKLIPIPSTIACVYVCVAWALGRLVLPIWHKNNNISEW